MKMKIAISYIFITLGIIGILRIGNSESLLLLPIGFAGATNLKYIYSQTTGKVKK